MLSFTQSYLLEPLGPPSIVGYCYNLVQYCWFFCAFGLVVHHPRVVWVVTVTQRVHDRVVYLPVHLAGGRAGLHGQELVGVAEFLICGRIGLSHISLDKGIVFKEFGERLANDGVNPVGSGQFSLQEVPLSSGLVVDQRQKNELVLQFYTLAPDLDSHGGYKSLDLIVDFVELRH